MLDIVFLDNNFLYLFSKDQNDEECNCKPGQKGSRVSCDITYKTYIMECLQCIPKGMLLIHSELILITSDLNREHVCFVLRSGIACVVEILLIFPLKIFLNLKPV